jgi:dTDP-6-deoxy-L-talose 4-dehydrogenase (NAD+)
MKISAVTFFCVFQKKIFNIAAETDFYCIQIISMEKILITGANGFIGRHVVKLLAERLDVNILLTGKNGDAGENSRFTFKQYEIGGHIEKNFSTYFENSSIVLHLAWQNLGNFKSIKHLEDNLLQHYNFLKSLVLGGAKKIIVVGTCLEYGLQNGELSEDTDCKPITAYGMSKDYLRKMLELLKKEHDFSLVWLRVFYPYGIEQSSKSLVPQLLRAIANQEKEFKMSKGEQLRDFIPVEKLANLIIKVSLQKNSNGIYNCCSGNPISVRAFVEKIIEENKAEIKLNLGYFPYPDYEPMAFWGNNQKILNLLNLTKNDVQ